MALLHEQGFHTTSPRVFDVHDRRCVVLKKTNKRKTVAHKSFAATPGVVGKVEVLVGDLLLLDPRWGTVDRASSHLISYASLYLSLLFSSHLSLLTHLSSQLSSSLLNSLPVLSLSSLSHLISVSLFNDNDSDH